MTEDLPYTAERNVQSVKGGKVHHGMPEDIAEVMGREHFPRCRTLDQNRVMTHYRACDLPVDCTTCLTLAARVAERRAVRAAAAVPSIPQVPAGRQAAPKTTDPAKTDRNATAALPSPPAGPPVVITVLMRNHSAGIVYGPGWIADLIHDHAASVYRAIVSDAAGETLLIGRSCHHKERAVAELARLMGVTAPITVALSL
jgi:hypothetical protein